MQLLYLNFSGSLTFAGFMFLILWINLWKDIWKALFCLRRNVPCVHDVQRLLWIIARRNGRLRTLYCCFYDGIKTSPPVYIACSLAWSFLHHSENEKTRKLDVIKKITGICSRWVQNKDLYITQDLQLVEILIATFCQFVRTCD